MENTSRGNTNRQNQVEKKGKCNSENIVRNIQAEKLQVGKDKSKESKSESTKLEI